MPSNLLILEINNQSITESFVTLLPSIFIDFHQLSSIYFMSLSLIFGNYRRLSSPHSPIFCFARKVPRFLHWIYNNKSNNNNNFYRHDTLWWCISQPVGCFLRTSWKATKAGWKAKDIQTMRGWNMITISTFRKIEAIDSNRWKSIVMMHYGQSMS